MDAKMWQAEETRPATNDDLGNGDSGFTKDETPMGCADYLRWIRNFLFTNVTQSPYFFDI